MPFRLLSQLNSPEYRERHLFTARLRLVIFIGFWVLYIYFFHGVLSQLTPVTLIVLLSFLAMTLSYYWVLKNRFLLPSIVLEIAADLVTITAILHIAEGPYSDFFTLYLFYIFAAGIFYNYLLALCIALACALCYGSYLLLCEQGVVLPLILDWGEKIPIESHSPPYHFFFFALFALLVVYAVKVASYFSQKRERMLESRNKELSALAQMGSTIRTTISVEKVLEQILEGLEAGLDLPLTCLVLFDREKNRVRLLANEEHPLVKEVEALLKNAPRSFHLPLQGNENIPLKTLLRNQIVFRKNLAEVLTGLEPPIEKTLTTQIQNTIGFQKMVGVPLVAEREVLGALLGFTPNLYIDPPTVKTLEAFANQAALVLEATLLIQRLREANENLREANRVKSEFLATMSHELRTPLTAIIGFSELLLEGVMGKLTQEQEESLREVLNNGATLLEMINNLLDMAKVEAGKMELEIQPFDLKELLQRLSHTIASLLHKKGQSLRLDLPKQVPPIHADERKVQQVLLNLLSNAIKFTPEGGTIEVGLEFHNGRDCLEKVSWSENLPRKEIFSSGAFELFVRDTGIGIRPEHISKVFDMFSQVDSSVTRGHGGTGLGLTLAKQFTELHQGLIWVESEYGKGAKFTVVLPQIVVG